MSAVLTMRANEMASLRDANRRLTRRIAEMEAIVRDNDSTITMMHRIALILVARERGWRERAEKLLQRGMKTAGAHIYAPEPDNDGGDIAKKIARLPAGGRADDRALCKEAKKGALYYHLPLKNGRRVAGLLTLTLKHRRDLMEGEDEFCRRLASLLALALIADAAQKRT